MAYTLLYSIPFLFYSSQQVQQGTGCRASSASGRAAKSHRWKHGHGTRVQEGGPKVGGSRVHVDRRSVHGLAPGVPVVEDAGVLAVEGRHKDPRGTPRECPQSVVLRLQHTAQHIACIQYSF